LYCSGTSKFKALYDSRGQMIRLLETPEMTLDLYELSSGIYWVLMDSGEVLPIVKGN
jgi:hypothetical protein